MKNTVTYTVFAAPPKNAALHAKLLAIVEHAARNPDQGSEFDKATRDYRHAPRDVFLEKLRSHGYDAIVAVDDEENFLGFAGFQDHPDGSRQAFAFHVPPELESGGIGTMLVGEFLERAHKAGIVHVRVYGGNVRNELADRNKQWIEHMYNTIVLANALRLPFNIKSGNDVGWVTLEQPAAAVG